MLEIYTKQRDLATTNKATLRVDTDCGVVYYVHIDLIHEECNDDPIYCLAR